MRTTPRLPRLAPLLLVPLLAVRCGGGGGGRASDADVRVLTDRLPAGWTGAPYEAAIEVVVPHPPAALRVVAGRLPPGLALDSATGVVHGRPTAIGAHRFEVEVRDGEDPTVARDPTVAAARAALEIEVARGPLVLLPGEVAPLGYRRAFLHRFEAAGGTPPYAYRAAGAAWPAGTFLGADGEWRGAIATAGDLVLRLRATDAAGGSVEGDYAVRVVLPPLALDPAPPPSAAHGSPYAHRFRLHPAGAGPPHAFRVVGGALPPGLALDSRDGQVSGTPEAVGTFAFTVEATDEAGQAARLDTAVVVAPAPVVDRLEPSAWRAPAPEVALHGAGFAPGLTVRFGVADPVAADVRSGTLAFATPPTEPLQSGPVEVVVENVDGGRGARAAAFRYPLREVVFERLGVFGTARGKSRGLACGDLDGDGRCDLAHAGSSGIEVLLSRATTPPSFSTTVVRSDGSFDDLRVGDVDADGDLDLVVARSSTTDSIECYRNDGTGRFPSTASATTSYARPPSLHQPHTLATGDVDGDGVLDAALTSARGNQGVLWVFRGMGDGSFALAAELAGSIREASGGIYAPAGVVLADLDGDGRDDVVLSDAVPAACSPGAPCPSTPGTNPHPGARDFLAWTSSSDASGVPTTWHVVRAGEGAVLDGDNPGLCALDEDGDGRPDVAVFGGFRDERGMGLAFLRNGGDGRLEARQVVATAYARRFGARIDADLDACQDLLVVGGDGMPSTGDGQGFSVAEVWRGGALPAARAWTSGPETLLGGSVPGANPGRACVGDFDGDGLDDFAVSQSFHVKERFSNEQADGNPAGVCVWLSRSR
jgi:hypothetical protein